MEITVELTPICMSDGALGGAAVCPKAEEQRLEKRTTLQPKEKTLFLKEVGHNMAGGMKCDKLHTS